MDVLVGPIGKGDAGNSDGAFVEHVVVGRVEVVDHLRAVGLAAAQMRKDRSRVRSLVAVLPGGQVSIVAVHQAGQSLIVARRGAKEIRIRANFKRIASQPIKARVHSAMPSST